MAKTILVVDDSESDRYIFKYMVQKISSDIRVLNACDGADALDILQSETPDFLFVDINMPGMNGFEFLEKYSEEYDGKRLDSSVFMLSSSDQSEDVSMAEQYGFVKEYLIKPLDSEKIQEILNSDN